MKLLPALLLAAMPARAVDIIQPAWVSGGSVAVSNTPGVNVTNWPAKQVTQPAPAASATLSVSVAISTTPVQIVAANTNRKGLLLYNPSTSALYLAYDTTVSSATHYTLQLPATSGWNMPTPIYQGAVSVVRGATGDGKVLITDLQ